MVQSRLEGCRYDALVVGEQVIGELVKVGDPSDSRGRRDDHVAPLGEIPQEVRISGIAFSEQV